MGEKDGNCHKMSQNVVNCRDAFFAVPFLPSPFGFRQSSLFSSPLVWSARQLWLVQLHLAASLPFAPFIVRRILADPRDGLHDRNIVATGKAFAEMCWRIFVV